MRKTFRILLFSALMLTIAFAASATEATDAASALASRILPRLSRNVVFVQEESDKDFYSLETVGNKLIITGNNSNSMAVGLNNYLRNWCDITVTWFARDAVKEPCRLPVVEEKIVREALVGHRFFLNYCTYGYTLCWWQWEDWERLIDWMALNGVTLALANTGQEAVWQKVWMEFGMSEEQTRGYFTGPAFLAWHRMSNIDAWDGPLPQSWIDSQAELQKKIVARELSLGISPILTSFNGHIPAAMRELYPEADIKYLSDWGSYERRGKIQGMKCSYLNPADPLYNKIQKRFLEVQKEMFGQDCHIYGIDPFNEVDPPCWEADFLADAGRRTYETLAEIDPEAVWLQMGWLFFYDKRWTKDLVEAYISPVPKGKLIMIDYFCEKAEVYRQTDSFFGQDFIWSYLGNFGGNTMISGDFKDISFKLDRAYAEAGEGMTGVGCTLEGLGVDPPVYEYVLDRAWEKVMTDEEWIANLADRHAGFESQSMRRAWRTMYDECHKQIARNRGMTISCRPNMNWWNSWRNKGCCYDNHHLLSAWGDLVSVRGSRTPAFRFDCVNIARQCLENYFSDLYQEMHAAYDAKDRDGVAAAGEKMSEVLDDLENLCGSDAYFLMGKWIEDARAWGVTPEEKDYFEKDARLLLTCWAFQGAGLTDYANRCWNGLLSTYYKPRWESFTQALLDGLDGVKPFNYDDWLQTTTEFEWNWATELKNVNQRLAVKPSGNSLRISRNLYKKYKECIEAAPGTSGIVNTASLAGDRLRRLVVIDPGHPHASGVQSARLKGVSDTVLVFAPEGPELNEYLRLVNYYNSRKKDPTSWDEQVYTGKDYLKKIPKAGKGDFVVLAGKNSKKPDYVLQCIKKGYNVFSDKPMVVDGKGYKKLEKAYRVAGRKGLILFDEMTERYNTRNILCREILSMGDVVGKISSYYIFDVHHYYKKSAGKVTLRPAWFFDVREQGEGIADVSTHFVDLAMWQCSPDVPVTESRISGIKGSHYPTVITREQFEKVSGEKNFPGFLSQYIKDGRLEVNSNGTLEFNIDSIPVKLDIEWRYGNDSTRDIFRQEIKCDSAVIRLIQDESTSNIRKMTVELSDLAASAVSARLSDKYPWASLLKLSDGLYEVIIDEKKTAGFAGGGSATISKFLSILDGEPMPDWESINTLSKYHITTSAVESLK